MHVEADDMGDFFVSYCNQATCLAHVYPSSLFVSSVVYNHLFTIISDTNEIKNV